MKTSTSPFALFVLENFAKLSEYQKKRINYCIKRDIPIIIKGEQKSQGKTTLKEELQSLGAIVYEHYEILEIIFPD